MPSQQLTVAAAYGSVAAALVSVAVVHSGRASVGVTRVACVLVCSEKESSLGARLSRRTGPLGFARLYGFGVFFEEIDLGFGLPAVRNPQIGWLFRILEKLDFRRGGVLHRHREVHRGRRACSSPPPCLIRLFLFLLLYFCLCLREN